MRAKYHLPTTFLLLLVADCSALFKHKVRIVACVEKLASGNVRMWDEPWQGTPESDEAWDTYYGGSVESLGRGKVWSKTWTSELDLFDNSTEAHPNAFLFQDLVLGGEDDEVCISDIRAETQQSDGKYKVRWRLMEDFWLAGYGSNYYQKSRINKSPCYTELQVGGCAVTFARDNDDGVDHFMKHVATCKDGRPPASDDEEGINVRELFPRRRLGAPLLQQAGHATHEF
ncbi:expressed unknown protein [Seminavis robusta]|uniref:Uncharacterized protein n=1 Tax=Seminavis robusta TaxID=568900 RepID=A0A9N8HCU7_9STRA|nr:expressed unknown protein [Seminavis robusta]|eukprot:Sro234_g094320.1 n/a (229) ;mRNA; f:12163-12849